MKRPKPHPIDRPMPRLIAVALALGFTVGSAFAVRIDFEAVPDIFNHDGLGLNLGDYYVAQPGGPIFGPQTTVLEAGRGSLNDLLFPPRSGVGVLWGMGEPIEISFSTGLASAISFYYRSNTELFLYAFDLNDLLLGSSQGRASLAPGHAPGMLSFSADSYSIARVLIGDSGNSFVIDDLEYSVGGKAIPEPAPHSGATLVFGALGLGAWWFVRRRR